MRGLFGGGGDLYGICSEEWITDALGRARLLDNFDTWIVTFAEAERAPAGIDATATLLTYMFRVIDPVHHDQLRAKIRQLGPHAEETAMTIAEQWHEEGRKEGIAKGREEGIAKGRVLVADSLAAVFED